MRSIAQFTLIAILTLAAIAVSPIAAVYIEHGLRTGLKAFVDKD